MARSSSSQITVGAVLLVAGGILLATRFVAIEAGPAWMLGIGCALALTAILRRHYPSLVGGMVLLGLGAGMVLGERGIGGIRTASWVVAGLAAGLVVLWAIATLLKISRSPWPLAAGAVLLAVLGLRYLREFTLLPPAAVVAVRTWWPAALVAAGLILLLRGLRR
jgi:hypothetical protein